MTRSRSAGIALSRAKVCLYLAAIAILLWVLASAPSWPVTIVGSVLLGITFAHGLELQHEALHGILFKTDAGNRLLGSILGFPMLATYTDTRVRHLLHHRYNGTEQDVFDRRCHDFRSGRDILGHVFDFGRLPSFVAMIWSLQVGRYRGPLGNASRELARTELLVTAAGMAALLMLSLWFNPGLALWGWIVPALVVAPPCHFLMTSAEHLGRPASRRLDVNTRTYRAPGLWRYLIHYDNYHVEHHLRPSLPFHLLPAFHAERCRRAGEQAPGYRQSMRDVFRAMAACVQASPQGSSTGRT
ncbi:MAG: fatty acid desaturase [Hyphomicrobiales bacterium]|nr:fatty acid desaturase [Hyphomicrobiales bacterium]MBV8825981.1 fatty acid desaturase [Hyphomicrobiales bacterium]MBV9428532.1 fatty acid desaturase [Bradyrhizobiaceae bacterium]